MGITGLIPFLEKASRRANVDEFSGCTVAIDSYCWLHKGAFACADKIVRGEETDIHIKYCLKYVTMLLSKNIKPILVFDGRHLPAKAMTEAKRRESRDISKKRAAELLSLGQIEEARSFMRRGVDITHAMALSLIKECRRRNVDCIVAPYEADSQLAYLNVKNVAQLVITEDSDLILFGCTKVLFKMDLDGNGTLVDTARLPLVMRCPIERYSFDRFRQMCIMSGCDYVASLPGIGLAKARQFVVATQDSNFANALKKLPSFFNKSSLTVTDEYRAAFLQAEATFKHQYVYDPLEREMKRLTECDDEDTEQALCCNAGELLDPDVAFQLALGNRDPFSLRTVDDWHPDRRHTNDSIKTDSWAQKPASHASIWDPGFSAYLTEDRPWAKKEKKPEPIIAVPKTRPRKKVVNMVPKYVAETQDESLSIETLSSMYCVEPKSKKPKFEDTKNTQSLDSQEEVNPHDKAMLEDNTQDLDPPRLKEKSPILENKERSFAKCLKSTNNQVLKKLSRFPRTVLDDNIVESKFFSPPSSCSNTASSSPISICIEESPEKKPEQKVFEIDTQCSEIPDSQPDSGFETLSSSQKENSPENSPVKITRSPILEPSPRTRNPFRVKPLEELKNPIVDSEVSVIEDTCSFESLVVPVDPTELTFGSSSPDPITATWRSKEDAPLAPHPAPPAPLPAVKKKLTCKADALKRPANQPTLLSMFGFQKRPTLKK